MKPRSEAASKSLNWLKTYPTQWYNCKQLHELAVEKKGIKSHYNEISKILSQYHTLGILERRKCAKNGCRYEYRWLSTSSDMVPDLPILSTPQKINNVVGHKDKNAAIDKLKSMIDDYCKDFIYEDVLEMHLAVRDWWRCRDK